MDVLLKVKGTSLRIFHERLLIMYSCSFSSAAFLGSGIANVIGFLSFLPRGLWVMVVACIGSLPRLFTVAEFFASRSEAQIQHY